MINYESLKKIFLENKPKFILGSCFVLVFILGFGAGKVAPAQEKQIKSQPKYTAKTEEKPAPNTTSDAQLPKEECLVKGSASSKIYHVKSGAFYDRLKSPQCFASEAEAKAAGFRKSSR